MEKRSGLTRERKGSFSVSESRVRGVDRGLNQYMVYGVPLVNETAFTDLVFASRRAISLNLI